MEFFSPKRHVASSYMSSGVLFRTALVVDIGVCFTLILSIILTFFGLLCSGDVFGNALFCETQFCDVS